MNQRDHTLFSSPPNPLTKLGIQGCALFLPVWERPSEGQVPSEIRICPPAPNRLHGLLFLNL